MKPDTYDTIIDTTKELFGYSGWLVLVSCVISLALAAVYYGFLELLEIELSMMFLSITNIVISLTIIFFMFMIRKAYDRFRVSQWRDYWMAFAHTVELSFDNINEEEIKNWLDENTPRLYRILERNSSSYRNTRTIVFKHRKDAVACKLKWI